MNKTDKAINYFRNSFNCSQSVLTAFGTDLGVPEDTCLKLGCAFGAGMGRQQFTCGAVTGALMVLGLRYGKGLNDPEDKKQVTYKKTREFFSEFKKIHGSASCRELLDGLDINDPGDHQKIIDRNLFAANCERYVADATQILEKMLYDH